MARKITEQEYSEYEKMLKKYQRMRRKIIKAHKNIAESSRSYSRLPQMVAPEREVKVSLRAFRMTGRRAFRMKMRQLKKLVYGGYAEFYKDFKKQYLELYRNLIDEQPEDYTALQLYNMSIGKEGGEPVFYSEYQIKLASKDEAQFMRNYNNIVRMNPMVFAYLIKTGRIPEFKKLYAQFQGEVRTQENWLDAMSKAIKLSRRFSPSDAERILTGDNLNLSKSNQALLELLLNEK